MQFKALISLCLLGQAVAQATTESQPSGSQTLPPSPTGSICHPHGDHLPGDFSDRTVSHPLTSPDCMLIANPQGHCEPTSTAAVVSTQSAAGTCTPHKDHWHCPSGVSKPATPPAQTQSSASASSTGGHDHDDHDHGDGKECTPHNDHWHCPSGVSSPTYPPTAVSTRATTGAPSGTASGSAASATSTTATAGAGRANAVLGAASLLGAVLVAAIMA
ncbi:hypothetical protein VCV18_001091 [Metarhizium anisopliae]